MGNFNNTFLQTFWESKVIFNRLMFDWVIFLKKRGRIWYSTDAFRPTLQTSGSSEPEIKRQTTIALECIWCPSPSWDSLKEIYTIGRWPWKHPQFKWSLGKFILICIRFLWHSATSTHVIFSDYGGFGANAFIFGARSFGVATEDHVPIAVCAGPVERRSRQAQDRSYIRLQCYRIHR